MDIDQKVAFIQSQTVCALAEIEGMKAENQQRVCRGEYPSYTAEEFFAVPGKYGMAHNDVVMFFKD